MSDFEDNQALGEMSVDQILAMAKQTEKNFMEMYRDLKILERECLNFHVVDANLNCHGNSGIQNTLRTIIEVTNELEAEVALVRTFIKDMWEQINAMEKIMAEKWEMFDPPNLSDNEIESVELLDSSPDQQETEDIL